jgi:hypothetical protein
MNPALFKSLVAAAPVFLLFFGALMMFLRGRTLSSLLQLFGAGCLAIVVLTHFCEALHLLPWMHWGDQNSVGHYLDLGGAAAGFTLFPIGYLLHVLSGQRG